MVDERQKHSDSEKDEQDIDNPPSDIKIPFVVTLFKFFPHPAKPSLPMVVVGGGQ